MQHFNATSCNIVRLCCKGAGWKCATSFHIKNCCNKNWPFSYLTQHHPTYCNMLQQITTGWPNVCNMLCTIVLPDVALNCWAYLAGTGTKGAKCTFNPLTPRSDQDRISPYKIITVLTRQVMRIKKYIKLGLISWSNSKFSDLPLWELYGWQ